KTLAPLIATEELQVDILDPSVRWRLIQKICESQKNPRPQWVYGILTKFWQGGQCNQALLPSFIKCGRRGERRTPNEGDPRRGAPRDGGINVTEKHLSNILFYVPRIENGEKFISVYENMVDERYSGAKFYPSLEQFKYHIKKHLA